MKLSAFQKGLALVIILLILGGVILINRVLLADVFNKEEAQHALYGLWLYKDLKAFDLRSFWYDTQRQMFWPFLHSWILSIFFLFFGVSYVTARFLSLLIFVATLALMYLASARTSREWGWKIGLLSVFLALTSPMMVRFGCENTLESLGAFIFIASFYFYTICEERKVTFYYVPLALLLGLSIYTSYLYAYFIIPSFIIVFLAKLGPTAVEATELSRKGEKAALPFLWWAYRKLIVLTILLILAGTWFLTSAFSRKIMLFMQAIFRHSGGEVISNIWQGLVFYPLVIIRDYTFSPWLGTFIFISLFLPFVAFHYRQFNKLYTFIWTVLVLATLTVPVKASQFIYIIAPFVFMLFSAAVFYVVEKARRYATAFLVVIFLPILFSFPQLLGIYFPVRRAENMAGVLNYFRQVVLPRHPIAVSVNLQHLNPEVIAFHFWDWNAPVLADSTIGEDEMLRAGRYFLTVELEPDSPYQSEILDDSIHRWNAFLLEKLKSQEIREFSSRRFESLALTAKVYEKQAR